MITTEELPESLCRGLTGTAKRSFEEVCGFILDDFSYHIIKNVAPRPQTSFFMDPIEQIEFLKENHKRVVGVWHTHPTKDAIPSEDDMSGWHPRMPWRYFVVNEFEVNEYKRGEDGTAERTFNFTRRG